MIARFSHGFAVDWMRKDLAICLEEARSNGAAAGYGCWISFTGMFRIWGGRWDASSLLQRLRKK